MEKYLPEFKGQMVVAERDAEHVLLRKPRHPVTLRNMLSHTSGLPYRSKIEEPSLDLFPLATRVRSYAMTPLEQEPGAKYVYSNAGINAAGRIIEVVSGQPFETFLEQRLLQPLGMKDTTFWPEGERLARVAKAYRHAKDGKLEETKIEYLKYPLDDRRERYSMPAGGLFATAEDMSRFYRMLAGAGTFEGKRILSEAAVKEMLSKQTGELPTGYGLGFSVDAKSASHGGAYNTMTRLHRERGIITVFLGQHGTWPEGNNPIIPGFEKAAVEMYGQAKP